MKLISRYLIGVCILALALSGCSGKKNKVYRIGIVSGAEPFAGIADGFKTKMAELGYIEGKNIVYDLQKCSADPECEKRTVKKFVEDKVDLMLTFPTEPTVAAKAATKGTNIPVVFACAGLEETDIVESISRPGGNIAGVRFPGPELTAKRLEILLELTPRAKRIYLVYDRNYPYTVGTLEMLRPAASSAGITLIEDPVNNLQELQAVLQKRDASGNIGIDAILIMPEILTQTPDCFEAIVKFANKHNVPIGGSIDFTADLGAVFSFIPNNLEFGHQAAILADKILKGAPAGEIMVVTPYSRLRLNYKVIKKLGLKVPEDLLSRADEIIH